MKYKLKDNAINISSDTYLEDYFLQNGITKLSSFLDAPDMFDEAPADTLSNITEGVKLLKRHIDNKSSIFIQVD